jgi:hypothetical protein
VDNHIYIKFKVKDFTILVLYVGDILLASSDKNMFYETKSFPSSNVIGIEIHWDQTKGILGLSQKSYIDRVLKTYNMHKCSSTPAPVLKGDKFSDITVSKK